jgi:hypothetical protein
MNVKMETKSNLKAQLIYILEHMVHLVLVKKITKAQQCYAGTGKVKVQRENSTVEKRQERKEDRNGECQAKQYGTRLILLETEIYECEAN